MMTFLSSQFFCIKIIMYKDNKAKRSCNFIRIAERGKIILFVWVFFFMHFYFNVRYKHQHIWVIMVQTRLGAVQACHQLMVR
jgi:hypothetical protein